MLDEEGGGIHSEGIIHQIVVDMNFNIKCVGRRTSCTVGVHSRDRMRDIPV